MVLEQTADLAREAYQLDMTADTIRLRAAGLAGFRHGLTTLLQIIQSSPDVRPRLTIEDGPAREVRGYLLDISRDKVPTMTSLRALISQLAALKYNQIQLYTEHTFAYPGHERVWGSSSPLTAQEVRELDTWCIDHGIELVPCINTMGHWERWLKYPEYFKYAECPYGWRRPDGHGMPHGSTLTPSPESLELLRELMGEYLPLFSSDKVNIGGDEPWELGMGRSRERCESEGRYQVYTAFLRKIMALAREHKSEVLFWGDIVLEAPEKWSPTEKGCTALIWGYEAGHPFDQQSRALQARGQRHYLCPGTSTWNSLGGRLGNALENIREATECAEIHHLSGLILTDWGDHGHHQPQILSLPALQTFAQGTWNPGASDPISQVSEGTFHQSNDGFDLAPILVRLGHLYREFDRCPPNRLPLTHVLISLENDLSEISKSITDRELEQAQHLLSDLHQSLHSIERRDDEGTLVLRELQLVLDLHAHAIDRLKRHRGTLAKPPARLSADGARLIGEFEELWLKRNRIGGLHESSGRLRRAVNSYPTDPARRPAWPPSTEGI